LKWHSVAKGRERMPRNQGRATKKTGLLTAPEISKGM